MPQNLLLQTTLSLAICTMKYSEAEIEEEEEKGRFIGVVVSLTVQPKCRRGKKRPFAP